MANEIKMGKSVTVDEVVEQYTFLRTEDVEKMSDAEIQAKIEELNQAQEDHGKLLQTKMYAVKIENQANLNLIKKWMTKEVEWDHSSVPTLVAVFDGLRRAIETGIDKEGNAYMSTLVVGHLYQYLLTFKGKGYETARSYLTLLTKVGGPISEAMRELADDNEHFRNLHQDLVTLEQVVDARSLGITVEKAQDENFKEIKKSKSKKETV